jgi:hypothetical protein
MELEWVRDGWFKKGQKAYLLQERFNDSILLPDLCK